MFSWTRSSSSTAGADLDQELVPHGAEEPFDLAPAGGLTGPGVDEPDPQRRAGPQQLLCRRTPTRCRRRSSPGCRGRRARRAARPRSRTVSSRRAHRYPVSSPGVVVDEREQDRLAAVHGAGRAARRRSSAAFGRVGLEPAERRRRLPVGAASVELEPGEVALQGPLVRAPSRRARRRIAATCAAVRSGHLPSSARPPAPAPRPGSAVRPVAGRGPARRTRRGASRRIHRSIVARDTRTGCPNGPGCSGAAPGRGPAGPAAWCSTPRSAASRISAYRNSPTARARARRAAS